MSGSGLAAVHAAANASVSPAAIAIPPAAPSPAAAAAPATTVADLVSAYPDLCTTLRAEGATAERARLLGIEAHAMPGHEKLIAEMKADGSMTPDMAAGRILAAHRAGMASQLQGIKDVENLTGKVPAAPSSAPSVPSNEAEKATTPEGWKAEYAASPKLQAEFGSAETYVAFKANESKVRILGPRK